MNCAGCNKSLEKGFNKVDVELAPGVTVTVCRNQQTTSGYYPKESCRQAARNKHRACPGCGLEIRESRWFALGLCVACQAAIERQRQTKPPSDLVWVGIDQRELVEDSGWSTEHREVAEQIVEMLARCLAESIGRWQIGLPKDLSYNALIVPSQSSGRFSAYGRNASLWLEVRQDRVDALQWAIECIRALMKLQYHIGVDRGHNALSRLAAGEVSVANYEQERKGR